MRMLVTIFCLPLKFVISNEKISVEELCKLRHLGMREVL